MAEHTSNNTRVVITGMGIVAPNGVGLSDYEQALREGRSGIAFIPRLADLKFGCQVGGIPPVEQHHIDACLTPLQVRNFDSDGIIYGMIAADEAWKQAGLELGNEQFDPQTGVIFGTGTSGIEKLNASMKMVDEQKVRRLGSNVVIQTMASGVSAFIAGHIGAGNQVTTNSSACTTGTEALLMGYRHIKAGYAERMLVGSTCEHGPYLWAGFDAMRVTSQRYNDVPQKASRPMSASAAGLVPGGGAGAFVIETLESALKRKAPIIAEVLGGQINSGGQRGGGTLTAPNPKAVRRCITDALTSADVAGHEIDLINGHLTATAKDPDEVAAWVDVLGGEKSAFPYLQSTKSMVGHCLSGSGAVELVATALQIQHDFVHPSINSEDLHENIAALVPREKIPQQTISASIKTAIKASFGFGDVNGCVVLRQYNS
ncbi:beta-ketoacyl-[acyl-carrier-protein] synthase family protein [Gilvibacter sediminis]|uniref:beta-ketoacyl-[acyl-carrier-protein] synthase family protein n=1 Tax=Gilvibacter sediminis TaxID=379071 RepID=UPI00234FC41B|nr:beta-ketoacyl-[acyl-carrier-protein] synthase family protein [Gilvibacter sediminis]MDC7998509.1 beta-ketoacyl-[acyl-carrier-protein] synthase family protein [Gilvibacter sediminis]